MITICLEGTTAGEGKQEHHQPMPENILRLQQRQQN
jgi:hypothetical protein